MMLLKDYLTRCAPELPATIQLFMALAEELNAFHIRNTIYNDLHPGNIHIDPKSQSVLLSPSDLSFSLSETNRRTIDKDQIQGQITYLSPERTGRTAHSVDFRSDLYCLGVLLYETLAGVPPFPSDDPAQTLHGHVAVTPAPLHQVNIMVSPVLSDITLKLLSKNPADRYQSAGGLVADLSCCLDQLEESGHLRPFPLARKDVCSVFEIPDKLYGRHAEIKLLVDEYVHAFKGGVGMLFLSGPPGIGKSYLVNSTQSNLANDSGLFIHGKFDQYERTIPYSAVCEAFTRLAHRILTMDDKAFIQIREDILKTVGDSGQILTDAVPELELIIGKQQRAEQWSPQDNENRFITVVLSVIQAIVRNVKPLVLFLDDLHWADTASIELIQALLGDTKLSHVLFIGCCRDIEARENPALASLLNALKSQRPSAFRTLGAVDDDYVAMLLEDILSVDDGFNHDFVQFMVERTSGNPLFIREFLMNLYTEGWIRIVHDVDGPETSRWHVDMKGIQDALIPESVVGLLNERFLKQTPAVQELLKIAACVGTEFDAPLLARVSRKKVQDMYLQLNHAIKQGMVIETASGYKFIHDRVQETAYRLNNPHERAAIHYTIGKVLKESISIDHPGEHLFSVVSQLNNARELLTAQERHELTVLSLEASRKAKRVAAYTNAMAYIDISLELLPAKCWEAQYDLTLSIHTEAAKIAAVLGDLDYVKRILHKVTEKANELIEIVKVHESLIWGYTAQNMHAEAVRECLSVLKRLGFSFRDNPGYFGLLLEGVSTYCALKIRSPRALKHLKDARDVKVLAASRIMQIIYRSVQASNIRLYILLVLKGIKLSLKHGNTPDTAIRIAVFGGLLCCNTRAINSGYRFGSIASALASRPTAKRNKAETQAFIDGSIRPWKHHLRESLAPMLEVYNLGVATGSAARIGAINWYCSILFFTGEPLKNVIQKTNHYNETLHKYKLQTFLVHNNILLQAMMNLAGHSNATTRLSGDVYNEKEMVPLHISGEDQTALCQYQFYRMYLNYTFGNYDIAENSANEFAYHLHSTMGTFYTVMDCFYDSLSRLAWIGKNISDVNAPEPHSRHRYQRKRKLEKKWQLIKIAANHKRMKRWAGHAPMNIMNKLALVEAERARIDKEKEQAVRHYQRAIALSREHLYIQEEALANELLAEFHLSENNASTARHHLKEAYDLYEKWGAMAKCRQLEQAYGQLIMPVPHAMPDTGNDEIRLPSHPPVLNLSALAVQMLVDASKIITHQNEIENYLTRLFDTIMKYACAQRVLLLINREDKLSIRIDHQAGTREPAILKSLPENENLFPDAIIKYVMRTNREVLLDNAHGTKLYSTDHYIQANQVKSVICLPVNHDNRLLAVLYIENNFSYGVFGPQNCKVLKSICDHIALSFENRFLREAIMRLSEKDKQPTPEVLKDRLRTEFSLTPQEAKVASLFKEGYTRAQICETLNITLKTLRRHLQSVYNKTINLENDFDSDGRIDKLSRLILFLFKNFES